MTSISRPFVDKLLLSLIEPNMPRRLARISHVHEREKRLRACKRSMFGTNGGRNSQADQYALRYMASEYLLDRSRRVDKPRSIRKLAAEAAVHVIGRAGSSDTQRLRSIFRGKQKERYLAIALYRDEEDNVREHRTLQKFAELLKVHGVMMDIDALAAEQGVIPKRKARLASSVLTQRRTEFSAK